MRRGKPLERRTALRRSGPIKRQTPRRILRMSDEDRDYTAWLHGEPCAALASLPGHQVCSGPIQAAHLRDHTGLGLKAPADQQIPLCRSVHEDYDRHIGRFRDWPMETMKAWFREQLARVRDAWYRRNK